MVKFNLRKMLSMGLLAAALTVGTGVAAIHAVPGTVTMAATAAKTDVSYEDYTVTITVESGEAYVFLEVLKKKGDSYTVSATYPYAVATCAKDNKVVVDLSFLKATTKQYIRVYGDKGKAYDGSQNSEVIEVAAQAKKLSIKYKYQKSDDAATKINGHLTIKEGGEPITINDTVLEKYYFRTLYGSGDWNKLKDFNYAIARVAGTTIVVRKNAIEEGAEGTAAASPEVKVKITAIPKAPKVTVDYVKGIIGLSNKMEYGVVKNGTVEWVSTQPTGKMELAKVMEALGQDGTTAFTLVARIAESDTKPASAERFITIDPLATLADDKTSATTPAESGKITVTGDTNSPARELEYKYDSTKKGETVKDTGIRITAKNADFEYKVGTYWKKLAAGKSVYIKGISELEVRLSGVKENLKASPQVAGAFPSKEIKIKVVAPTPNDGGDPDEGDPDEGDPDGGEG